MFVYSILYSVPVLFCSLSLLLTLCLTRHDKASAFAHQLLRERAPQRSECTSATMRPTDTNQLLHRRHIIRAVACKTTGHRQEQAAAAALGLMAPSARLAHLLVSTGTFEKMDETAVETAALMALIVPQTLNGLPSTYGGSLGLALPAASVSWPHPPKVTNCHQQHPP